VTIAPEGVPGRFVSIGRGEVDRTIFSDAELFELEMEHIFGTRLAVLVPRIADPQGRGTSSRASWAATNVLVVRQKDQDHQGAAQHVLATEGNARVARRRGRQHEELHVHVPRVDLRPRGATSSAVPGLTEVLPRRGLELARPTAPAVGDTGRQLPRLFIFGTHDPDAPQTPRCSSPRQAVTVSTFPGASGRHRGSSRGSRSSSSPCNWKFAVDNLLDWYPRADHPTCPAITSGAMGATADGVPVRIRCEDPRRREGRRRRSPRIRPPGLDGVPRQATGHAQASPLIEEFAKFTPGVEQMMAWAHRNPTLRRPWARRVLASFGHTSIFPDALDLPAPSNQVCLRIPSRCVNETEDLVVHVR